MRSWLLLVSTTSALVCGLGACGGDDGGVHGTIDSNTAIDTVSIDSAPANVATKLGKLCDQTNACPAQAMDCVAFSMSATHGFCTLGCGTSNAFTSKNV